jgi:hypothetical protein
MLGIKGIFCEEDWVSAFRDAFAGTNGSIQPYRKLLEGRVLTALSICRNASDA